MARFFTKHAERSLIVERAWQRETMHCSVRRDYGGSLPSCSVVAPSTANVLCSTSLPCSCSACMHRVMNACVVLLVLLSVVAVRAEEEEAGGGFVPPTQPSGDVHFFETFNDEDEFNKR